MHNRDHSIVRYAFTKMVRETIENAIAGGKDSQFIEFLLLQGDIGLGYGQFGFGLFYVFDSSSSGQFSEFFMCRRQLCLRRITR
ncbi:Uncharacterised protein [Vibrio cholerae]|nr:Uncharacterised protein [Vibrio cholerae]